MCYQIWNGTSKSKTLYETYQKATKAQILVGTLFQFSPQSNKAWIYYFFFFFKFSHQPNKALILLELPTLSIMQNHFKKEKNSKAKEFGYHNKDCTTTIT